MADHDPYIPRGILHDAWWMSSDTVIRFPSTAWPGGPVRRRPPRRLFLGPRGWNSEPELANLSTERAGTRKT